MTRVCHVVPLIGSLLAAGCYETHRAPENDAAARDAGLLAAPPDPRAPRDAGLDALTLAPRCPAVRADATCLASFAIPAARPFELPLQFDGCACCPDIECFARADEATRTLSLSTHLCPDACDCATCSTPRGSCAVPALSAVGPWTVEVNGTRAFAIDVLDLSAPNQTPPPPGCATYAELDECGGAQPDLSGSSVRGSVCRVRGPGERTRLRIDTSEGRGTCWSCGDVDASCDVSVVPRSTDDLPAGGDIMLTARRYESGCDWDCPSVCEEHSRECELPPLVPGNVYRVFIDGELALSFVEGETSGACAL